MKKQYDEFVVLGSCCEPRFALNHLKIETKYPFDWSIPFSMDNFSRFCKIIENDLKELEGDPVKEDNPFLKHPFYTFDKAIQYPHYENNKHKMQEKIENFRKLLQTEQKVLFIWKGHPYSRFTPENAKLFIETIKKVSKIRFKILVINEYDTTEKPLENYPEECIVSDISVPLDGRVRIIDCNMQHDSSPDFELWKSLF